MPSTPVDVAVYVDCGLIYDYGHTFLFSSTSFFLFCIDISVRTNLISFEWCLENLLVQVRNNSEIIEIYAVCDLLENSQPIKFFDTSSN